MKPATPVTMTRSVMEKLVKAPPAQFQALLENVTSDGLWETADEVVLWWDFETLMVIPKRDGERLIVLGIEPDGYTHS